MTMLANLPNSTNYAIPYLKARRPPNSLDKGLSYEVALFRLQCATLQHQFTNTSLGENNSSVSLHFEGL